MSEQKADEHDVVDTALIPATEEVFTEEETQIKVVAACEEPEKLTPVSCDVWIVLTWSGCSGDDRRGERDD